MLDSLPEIAMESIRVSVPVVIGAILGWMARVRAEKSRREHELAVRFDQDRRQVYASYLGGLRHLFMLGCFLLSEGDSEKADERRRSLLEALQSLVIRHGELVLVASWPVVAPANKLKDLATEIVWGALELRANTRTAPEKLPPPFERWAKLMDEGQDELIEAARCELRIPSCWPTQRTLPRWMFWRRSSRGPT